MIVDRAPDGCPGIVLAGFTTLAEHSRLCLGMPAVDRSGARVYTRARKIHQVAMTDGPPLIEDILARGGAHLGEIAWLIPHQTSVRAIKSGERARGARLGERPRNVVVTVDDYGNTASTTLFFALHCYFIEGRFHAGDKILLLSVASGLEVHEAPGFATCCAERAAAVARDFLAAADLTAADIDLAMRASTRAASASQSPASSASRRRGCPSAPPLTLPARSPRSRPPSPRASSPGPATPCSSPPAPASPSAWRSTGLDRQSAGQHALGSASSRYGGGSCPSGV